MEQATLYQIRIDFLWDPEAEVWIATSENVPGLVLESGSYDALTEKVKIAVPELLALNGSAKAEAILSFHTERTEKVYA